MDKDVKGGKDPSQAKPIQGKPGEKPMGKGDIDKTKEGLGKPAGGKDGLKKPGDKY